MPVMPVIPVIPVLTVYSLFREKTLMKYCSIHARKLLTIIDVSQKRKLRVAVFKLTFLNITTIGILNYISR